MKRVQRIVLQLSAVLEGALRHWKAVVLLAALLLVLSVDNAPPGSMEARVDRELTGLQFDFFSWETGALWRKLSHGLLSPQRWMTEEARRGFVLDYLGLVAEAQRLEGEIRQAYVAAGVSGPDGTSPDGAGTNGAGPDGFEADESGGDASDPDVVTAELQARRAEVRRELRVRQPLAEAILEEQVAHVLADEGFDLLGQTMPPVKMHFTPLPQLLIISPRDRIERAYQMNLVHGLSTAEREAIEAEIDESFDVSSLVTGIGGLSAYPSMLLESSSINWVAEVTAHEWTHHYLTPRPLGWHYLSSGETRTINETVASIVGNEVGRRVVARYYPEYVPEEPEPGPEPEDDDEDVPDETDEPLAFDFRREMRTTRVRVDELLAEGQIEEAERYMEERRQLFVREGYAIRKLNQAYFAFHGAYADQPGAAGEDPIGPAVREAFARSPDLRTFVSRLAGVTTLEGLEDVLETLPAEPSAAAAF